MRCHHEWATMTIFILCLLLPTDIDKSIDTIKYYHKSKELEAEAVGMRISSTFMLDKELYSKYRLLRRIPLSQCGYVSKKDVRQARRDFELNLINTEIHRSKIKLKELDADFNYILYLDKATDQDLRQKLLKNRLSSSQTKVNLYNQQIHYSYIKLQYHKWCGKRLNNLKQHGYISFEILENCLIEILELENHIESLYITQTKLQKLIKVFKGLIIDE